MSSQRLASIWLAGAMAVAAITILWLNRGTTFWIDELVWLMQGYHLDLSGALHPHVGHLVLTSRLVYAASLDLFGTSYLPLRILATGAVLLTAGLFFAYARRRVGAWVALAPSVVLLFFGSDSLHVLVGNAFTVMLAVSCGVAALLALDRRDRKGDVAACALLCLGVVTYTVALGFVVGAAVRVALEPGRLRRAWIPLVPVAIYGSWFLWTHVSGFSSEGQVSFLHIFLFPVWGFQSLAAILSSLVGLNYNFPGSGIDAIAQAGGVLSLVALIAFGLRMKRGHISASLLASLAVLASLWALWVLAANSARPPDSSRYLLPGAVAVLLVAADSLRGVRISRTALIVIYAVAIASFSTNLARLRDSGVNQRDTYTVQVRAAFAALDIAGASAQPDFEPPSLPEGESAVGGDQSPLAFLFSSLGSDREPVPLYLDIEEEHGGLGYPPAELRGFDESVRAQTDAVLFTALGLELSPASRRLKGRPCRRLRAQDGEAISAALPAGGALLEVIGEGGSVELRRFADETGIEVGSLVPGQPAALRIPPDEAPDPWLFSTTAPNLKVCALR